DRLPTDPPIVGRVQTSARRQSRSCASELAAMNIVVYRDKISLRCFACDRGSRCEPLTAILDRDFEHYDVLHERFSILEFFRLEIVTFPLRLRVGIAMSFVRHFWRAENFFHVS